MSQVFVFDAVRAPVSAGAARMMTLGRTGADMARTLPRDAESRQALAEVGESDRRLGPVRSR